MAYTPRVVDQELKERLSATGAVVIEGPKACGKTLTARQIAASEVLLDVNAAARQAVEVDPSLILAGSTPRLIDEWQIAPAVWNYIRRTIDDRSKPGQFILTGSAVPADDISRHTGAGRITRLKMRPMSLYEAGHSTGAISLERIFAGEEVRAPESELTIKKITELVTIGGWPALQKIPFAAATRGVRDYLEEVRRVDVGRLDGSRRDPEKVGKLLRSLARNIATTSSIATLAGDAGGADVPLNQDTIRGYLEALQRLMIIEDQPAWAPHLRSRSMIRAAAKRHFVDPSLAIGVLRAKPEKLLRDLNLFGFIFESLVVRDLRIYSQALDGQVFHYRDNTGLEVDAIVELADGRWAAFEVKLGDGYVEQAATSLRKFAERVDTVHCGEPIVLGVIVGTGYGYTREDGVSVIPIGSLGP